MAVGSLAVVYALPACASSGAAQRPDGLFTGWGAPAPLDVQPPSEPLHDEPDPFVRGRLLGLAEWMLGGDARVRDASAEATEADRREPQAASFGASIELEWQWSRWFSSGGAWGAWAWRTEPPADAASRRGLLSDLTAFARLRLLATVDFEVFVSGFVGPAFVLLPGHLSREGRATAWGWVAGGSLGLRASPFSEDGVSLVFEMVIRRHSTSSWSGSDSLRLDHGNFAFAGGIDVPLTEGRT
ncbi:MAG: hypothetical protein NZ898_06775 [Myxococcota bacterium]|nr:hypothetical protein [Myxococcota bacterium]